ncbi:MAG: helicase-related protein, partial [Myxococcota bacterium]|nr:helicase-related protein [Myxococcota bacterium]
AKTLAQKLERSGYCAVALQGNMSQNQREKVMRGFRAGNYEVLVATDIAARGIDVAGVSHVINYDAPSTAEAYTHRIGRTGRAECSGKACTFITSEDRALVRAIERHINQKLPQEVLEEFTHHEGEDMRDVAPRSTKKAGSRRSGRPGGRPGAEGGSRPPARRRRSKGGKSSGSNAAPHRTRSSSRSSGAGESRDSR